jgi:hypothetical protein
MNSFRQLFALSVLTLFQVSYASSKLQQLESQDLDSSKSTISVCIQDMETGKALPARIILTASDKTHPDGSGRGVYRDGRFFAEGSFQADVPPGKLQIQIFKGANYLPIDQEIDVPKGKKLSFVAEMEQWFSPEEIGWYAGDNHVHALHDKDAAVKTDLEYTALQARANGLSFITEAGSNVDYNNLEKLSTDDFLMRYAGEVRPGCYVGHFNTPGIQTTFGYTELNNLVKRPLPAQAVYEEVRKRNGVVIHTHPMTPRHQLHWMGAGEAYSDAVMGHCPDLFDLDANHTRSLWFSILNLGNKVAASGYTDAALGRTTTLSPGDGRVYCQADEFTYESIVDAMRKGRTMVTNGGPVFAFLKVNGKGSGADLKIAEGSTPTFSLKVHSLKKFRSVALYMNGVRSHAFSIKGKEDERELSFQGDIKLDRSKASWIVALVDNDKGEWCITSPIYLTPEGTKREDLRKDSCAILFEISNHSRFAQLRKEYFAHILTTVAEGDTLKKVELLKNEKVLHSYLPEDGDYLTDEKIPTTELFGDYAKGWIWYPKPSEPQHFQADYPIHESGWYSVRTLTTSGKTHLSDSLYFNFDHLNSQATSVGHIFAKGTQFTLWGHAEDAPLDQVNPPYTQGNWWYSKNGYWRIITSFEGKTNELGWPPERDAKRFRKK